MLTLADRLIETSIAYRGPRVIRDGFKHVATKIAGAQRFIVADDVRGAIRALLTSRPSTLVAAARYARLPFSCCWFEWAAPHEANIYPGQVQVKRCGALMESYGEHGFTMFTAWEFDRRSQNEAIEKEVDKMMGARKDAAIAIDRSLMPDFGVSSLVGVYDFSNFIGKPPAHMDKRWFRQKALLKDDLIAQRDDEKNPIRHALKSEEEWQALKLLSESAAFRVHEECHGSERIADQFRQSGDCGSIIHDVQDEMGHLFATLILMNSKNGVDLAETKPDEQLNKARSKQGKSKLLPYSTVRIKLTNSQQRAVEEGRITRAEARRHPVRGHFKVRASGVFWWNEAWRGNALRGVIERRAHIIDAAHPITPAPEKAFHNGDS